MSQKTFLSQKTICPPTITSIDEHEKSKVATFVIEPLMPGYGQTLANSLRRVLLSSISGAAVVSFRIAKIEHEFSSIPGVKEDALEVKLNIMGLRFSFLSSDQEEIVTVTINKKGPGAVTGADIETGARVKVINPDHVIASLDSSQDSFEAEINVASGRGYLSIEESNALQAEKPTGFIVVDAHFCPVRRVRYRIDNTRVGQITNLDKVSLTVETDGSMTPQDALEESSAILQEHYGALAGATTVVVDSFANLARQASASSGLDEIDARLLEDVSHLGIRNRSINALQKAGYNQLKDIINLSDKDLADIPGLGVRGIEELKEKIKEMGFEEA